MCGAVPWDVMTCAVFAGVGDRSLHMVYDVKGSSFHRQVLVGADLVR
jgi:hypothetical protein